MFVNGEAFVVTVSRGLKFITTHYLPSREAEHLASSIRETIKIYQWGGFRVQTLLMDREFEKIKPMLPEVLVNTTSAGEHVGDIERHIRTIKERARGITCTLPYRSMLARMIVKLVYFCVMWLNAVPNKNGVSSDYSPREIVVRQKLDYKKHCRVPFGAYCKVFEDRERTNTMASRTRPAISLGPTGNMQGTYKFMCLRTGRVIKRRQFKELPMPSSMISRIEQLGAQGNTKELVFSDRHGIPFPWNDNADKAPIHHDHPGDTVAEFPGIAVEDQDKADDEEDDTERDQAARAAQNANLDIEQPQIIFGRRQVPVNKQALIQEILQGGRSNEADEGMVGDADVDDPTTVDNPESAALEVGDNELTKDETDDPNEAEERPLQRRSGRRAKGKRKMHTFATEFQGDSKHGTMLLALGETDQEVVPLQEDQIKEHIMGVVMTQYMIGPGLARFKKRGEEAVTAKLGKLHNMQTFVPMHREELSDEEHKKAVGSLMFLKEKQDQTVQGMMVADGRKQWKIAVNLEVALLTVCGVNLHHSSNSGV
ncbi:hypothetical protein ACHAXS_013136 [Conticribra weissflogii]